MCVRERESARERASGDWGVEEREKESFVSSLYRSRSMQLRVKGLGFRV
jgi:hypothetical protein